MKKELPGIYKNPIDHPVSNNKQMTYAQMYTNENKINKEEAVRENLFGKDIMRKISSIFNSPNYIYKAKVEIRLKDRTVMRNIIGKNRDSLITMENEQIPISEIIDIKIIDKKNSQ